MASWDLDVDLNLLTNAILNGKFEVLTSDPTGYTGRFYFNSTDNTIRVYNGSWKNYGPDWTAGDALTLTGTTLDVAVAAGAGGIEVSSDALRISAAAAGAGLGGGGGSALSVNVDTTTIEINSDTLRIAASAAGNGLTGGGASALAVNTGAGLEISSDAVRIAASAAGAGLTGGAGSALDVGAGTGITVNANDIAVDTTVIATIAYVDAARAGLDVKASVRVASTANVTLANQMDVGDSIDGVTLALNDRVLLKNQTSPVDNGIWVVTSGLPTRATDADAAGELSGGTFVFVEEGTTQADTGWVITTNGSITPGTTSHAWGQFSSPGTFSAGDGLDLASGVFSVDLASGSGLVITSTELDIDSSIVGKLAVSNTWTARQIFSISNANPSVDASNAGAGAAVRGVNSGAGPGVAAYTSFGPAFFVPAAHSGGAVFDGGNKGKIVAINDGSSAQDAATVGQVPALAVAGNKYSETYGNGVLTTFTITHNLGTRDVHVQVYDTSTYKDKLPEVVRATTNTLTLNYNSAPSSNSRRVVVTR